MQYKCYRPEPDGEVAHTAQVAGAGDGAQDVVGEGVGVQQGVLGHRSHLPGGIHNILKRGFMYLSFRLLASG